MGNAEDLHQIQNAIEKFSLSNLRPLLKVSTEFSLHQDVLDVAVLGRFKAGKTSVLNSLIGTDLLPTGVLPVTSVITRVTFGDEEMALVHFENGTNRRIGHEEISSFVAEQGNPNNIKQVEAIDIYTSRMSRFKNLRFVDTPGIGSIFQHNTEVAQKWLPNVGAALVCIAPDPPMSRQELDLLKEVSTFTPEIHIVLTKSDLVSDSDRLEIRQFIERHTEGVKVHSLIEYSIKPEFKEIRVAGLVKYLDALSGNAKAKTNQILSRKIKLLRELTDSSLRVALASALSAKDVRVRLAEKLKDAATRLELFEEECRILQRDYSARVRSKIAMTFSQSIPTLIDQLRSLAENAANSAGSVSNRAMNFEVSLNDELRNALCAVSQKQFPQALIPFHDSARQIRERAEHWLNSLSQLVFEAFGMELKQPPIELEPDVVKRPDIQISVSVDAPIVILGTIFPFLVSRGWLRRKFLRQISFEVEKNISRLTTQWHEISKEQLNLYSDAVAAHLRSCLETVESITQSTSTGQVDDINIAIETLSAPDAAP